MTSLPVQDVDKATDEVKNIEEELANATDAYQAANGRLEEKKVALAKASEEHTHLENQVSVPMLGRGHC